MSGPMMAALSGPPIPAEELSIPGQTNSPDSESSDEDDDGIPSRVACISPFKIVPGTSSTPTRGRLNLKRSSHAFNHDRRSTYPDAQTDLITLYPGLSKRQKVEHWEDTHFARIPLAPLPFQPGRAIVDAPPQNESVGSSAEEEAPEGVLYFLNSALRPTSQVNPEPEQHQHQHQREQLSYKNRQPPREMSREDEHIDDDNQARVDIANTEEEKEPEDPSHAIGTRPSRPQGNNNTRINKHSPHLKSSKNNVIEEANLGGEDQALADHAWEVPDSPEQLEQLEEPSTDAQLDTERRDGQSTQQLPVGNQLEESNQPLRRSTRKRPAASQPRQARRSQVHGPQFETVHEEEDGARSSHEDGGKQNDDNPDSDGVDQDDQDYSEAIDGFEDDGENTDIDLSAKESFEEDVKRFRSLRTVGTDDVKDFEGPSDDDVTAIHLDYQPLRRVCKLLTHSAWTGRKVDWQWRPFDCGDAGTLPGRTLLAILVRLERLYDAAPTAPNLKEQNRFLREYSDVLSYYFTRIKAVIDHIREERLAKPGRNESGLNTDKKKRKEMADELVYLIIPMLVHVLASAWGLGGRQVSQTSFTSATTELISRSVRWIMFLYRPLLRELRRSPLKKQPKQVGARKTWHTENERREDLIDLMEALVEVVQDAPDKLEKEEQRAAREIEDHKRWLKKQGERQAQEKLQEEARLKSIKEQKLRSLLSMRGIYYPLRSSSAAAPPPPLPPPASSPSSSSSSLSPSHERLQWSYEEKVFLFKKIQESYPTLPDLKLLSVELGKTVGEMEGMAEELLEAMLETVRPEETVASRSTEVRAVMQDYRLTYGR